MKIGTDSKVENSWRCPTLAELPPPPDNRSGWPWTEASQPLLETMPNDEPWPRISIVTPSYNQGQFIEETIRSVLLQGYPNLEYIIIDGGSTDNSVEIIKKYEPWLTYWVSETDKGQSQAINKGISYASGEIFAWLNSDDIYKKDVFQLVAQAVSHPVIHAVFGDCQFVDREGQHVKMYRGFDRPFYRKLCYWQGWDIPQPTVFVNTDIIHEVGLLNETLHLGLDYEWFLRIAKHYSFTHLGRTIACYRQHEDAKTWDYGSNAHQFYDEVHPFSHQYWQDLPRHQYWGVLRSYIYYRLSRAKGEGRIWVKLAFPVAHLLKKIEQKLF